MLRKVQPTDIPAIIFSIHHLPLIENTNSVAHEYPEFVEESHLVTAFIS